MTLYGRPEVTKDLIAALLGSSEPLRFDCDAARIEGLEADEPIVRYLHDGKEHELHADLSTVCFVGRLVASLRRTSAGRMMIALRSNERTAMAGSNVARTKLLAFGPSAFIADLAGSLYGYSAQNVPPAAFSAFDAVTLLAVVYIAGVGRIFGARPSWDRAVSQRPVCHVPQLQLASASTSRWWQVCC